MRVIGYCRVSTAHQNFELQIDAINQFAERKHIEEVVIYEEKQGHANVEQIRY